ncbi:MAG: hypothetical protein ACI8TQ_003787 [Planctomycetota bacterium]|jgi:hypothetical protein
MRKFFPILLALSVSLIPACGEPSAVSIQAVNNLISKRPTDVAQKFIDALISRDKPLLMSTLTDIAYQQVGQTGGLAFRIDRNEMLQAIIVDEFIDHENASVEVESKLNRGRHVMSIKMRKHDRTWGVYGVAFVEDQHERLVNFEAGSAQLAGARAIRDSGRSRTDQRFGRHSGSQTSRVATERLAYDALVAFTLDEHDAAWQLENPPSPASARELLHEVVGSSGLRFEEGRYARRLGQELVLELAGLGKLKAIEVICNEIGLIPVYPDQLEHSSDELPALRFYEGHRDWPVTFVGPFMLEIENLQISESDASGELVLAVRALGLAPAMLAANESMIQLLSPLIVQNEDALNMLKEPGQVYFTNPQLEDGLFIDRTRYEIVGVEEGMDRLDSVEGSVILRRPTAVYQGQFPDKAARRGLTLELGPWQLEWKQKGPLNRFELRGDDGDYQRVHVRFAPSSALGAPLEIQSQMAFAESDHLWADMDTDETPSALAAKVYEVKSEEYPFRFDDVLFPAQLDYSEE